MSPDAKAVYKYLLENGHVGRDHAVKLSELVPEIPFLRASKRPDFIFHAIKDELLDCGIAILGDSRGRYLAQNDREIDEVYEKLKKDAIHRLITCGKLLTIRKKGIKQLKLF